MSVCSAFSKLVQKLGPAPLPTLQEAQQLAQQIKEGDEEAFITVWRIWRFTPHPQTQSEIEIAAFIMDTWDDGCRQLKVFK